jgi:hypothetical protein
MVASADGNTKVDTGEAKSAAVRRGKFANVGDISSKGLSSLPQTDRNVKVKCLQWLNSIDQDTDTEGDE